MLHLLLDSAPENRPADKKIFYIKLFDRRE